MTGANTVLFNPQSLRAQSQLSLTESVQRALVWYSSSMGERNSSGSQYELTGTDITICSLADLPFVSPMELELR